ncbi:MAG: hypothetical protein WCA77_06560 [Thermoplasmata archaeon]
MNSQDQDEDRQGAPNSQNKEWGNKETSSRSQAREGDKQRAPKSGDIDWESRQNPSKKDGQVPYGSPPPDRERRLDESRSMGDTERDRSHSADIEDSDSEGTDSDSRSKDNMKKPTQQRSDGDESKAY